MSVKEYFDSNANPPQQGYVFVLLPERAKPIYEDYIKKAADSLGFTCESFLDLKGPGNILEDILGRIRKAEILICDLTDFTPNVMWEMGIGLTIKDADKVIVLRETGDTNLPFNIYNHRVTYEYKHDDQESLERLREILVEVMGRINRAGMRDEPVRTHEVRKLIEATAKCIESKDWITAEVLFENMNVKEPENWYIFNQWGIMLRAKNEFQGAVNKFNQAIEYARFEDEKAFIYTELGVLHQINRKHEEAEDWFRKAEKADPKNKHLYLAWAEFHDELGNYPSAQTKINNVLGTLKESDSEFKEFKLRNDYYHQKISDPSYRKTFDEFKRGSYRREPGDLRPRPPRVREARVASEKQTLPYGVTWEEMEKDYVGTVVEGTVNNIVDFGMFVSLSRNFTGLIHWKNLKSGFEQQFAKNQPVKVRIKSAALDRDGKSRIDLILVE